MAIYIKMHADATCFSCLLKNIFKGKNMRDNIDICGL